MSFLRALRYQAGRFAEIVVVSLVAGLIALAMLALPPAVYWLTFQW